MYDNHHNKHDNPSQTNKANLSSTRPPQLNQTVCGCRCGLGNTQEGGDGGEGNAEDDAASTLVASSEYEYEYPVVDMYDGDGEQGTGGGEDVNVEEFRARIWRYFHGVEGSSYQHHCINDVLATLPFLHHRHLLHHRFEIPDCEFGEDAADSIENEPGSGVHSVVGTDDRILRPMSPGPELGSWTGEGWERELETKCVVPSRVCLVMSPLRLTPGEIVDGGCVVAGWRTE